MDELGGECLLGEFLFWGNIYIYINASSKVVSKVFLTDEGFLIRVC